MGRPSIASRTDIRRSIIRIDATIFRHINPLTATQLSTECGQPLTPVLMMLAAANEQQSVNEITAMQLRYGRLSISSIAKLEHFFRRCHSALEVDVRA